MEPRESRADETFVGCANRVNKMIFQIAGFLELNWDVYLKRHDIFPKVLESIQRTICSIITRRLIGDFPRPESSSVLDVTEGHHPRTAPHLSANMSGAAELD